MSNLEVGMRIETSSLPMLGINTDPERSYGFLCDYKLMPGDGEEKLERLMGILGNIEQAEVIYRDRLTYDVQRAGKVVSHGLSLNEVVLGGHDGAK